MKYVPDAPGPVPLDDVQQFNSLIDRLSGEGLDLKALVDLILDLDLLMGVGEPLRSAAVREEHRVIESKFRQAGLTLAASTSASW